MDPKGYNHSFVCFKLFLCYADPETIQVISYHKHVLDAADRDAYQTQALVMLIDVIREIL